MKGLGERIRSLRKDRRLTLVEIAEKTGIDQATLSRIENGKMSGTLESHMKISQALGIRLPELYDDVMNQLSQIKEKSVKEKIETFSFASGAVAELLTTGILHKKMMPVLLKVKSKGHTEIEEYPAGTERFLYVVKGCLEVILGKDKRLLKEGESLYFSAAVAHQFKNPLKNEVRCLSVITPSSP